MRHMRAGSDESYVIDLCDRVLRLKGKRQHRFDFLRGDPGKNGHCVKLPVDAYYEELNLVIEYRETQHYQREHLFDKPSKLTISGCHRGEQRRRYDQRRRDILGKQLIELEYTLFEHNAQGRLSRNASNDEAVIREKLSEVLPVLHENRPLGGLDVIGHDLVVIREGCLTDCTFPFLLRDLSVQQLPHFRW